MIGFKFFKKVFVEAWNFSYYLLQILHLILAIRPRSDTEECRGMDTSVSSNSYLWRGYLPLTLSPHSIIDTRHLVTIVIQAPSTCGVA